MKKHGRQILLISSAAENEGKSTVAANLALALADRKKKVLLADCDFRKPSQQKIFGIAEGVSTDFAAWLQDPAKTRMDSVLAECGRVTLTVNQKSYEKTQQLIAAKAMRQFLDVQKERFDYIILDSRPMLAATDRGSAHPGGGGSSFGGAPGLEHYPGYQRLHRHYAGRQRPFHRICAE